MGPGVGPAAGATARHIDDACPATHVPVAGFADVVGHLFELEINCVAAYGAAAGITGTVYAPGRTVSRGQLATYLAGLLEMAGESRPAALPDAFPDDAGTTHERNIDWIASLAIVRGHRDGTYRPSAAVSRDQLSTFLNGTIRVVTGTALSSSVDHFTDDTTNVHRSNIDALAAAGIVAGVGSSHFDPSGHVLRGVMAAFLARSIDVLVSGGWVEPPFGSATLRISPTSATGPVWSTDTASDRGARSYTVSVPLGVSQITVALFPAEHITTSGSTKLFASNAVVPAAAGTSIEKVNGATKTAAGPGRGITQVARVKPVGGVVRFTIDSVLARSVVPVAYVDSISPVHQKLDLPASASPSSPAAALEVVAVAGAVTWQPPAPSAGQDVGPGTVLGLSLTDRFYTLDTDGDRAADYRITWATSDAFRYTATTISASGSITRSAFESWLSVRDVVDPSAYTPTAMTHVIAGDVPAAPTGVVATVTGSDTVTVTFAKPANPVATAASSAFRLERATVSGGTVGAYAEAATVAGDATASFTDVLPDSGTYSYRIRSRSVTGESEPSAAAQVTITIPRPATTSSSIYDTSSTGTVGANSILDLGDEIVLRFDRRVKVSSGWTIDLLDRDGTVGRLSASNATIPSSGQVLLITMTSTPTILTAGTSNGVDIRGPSQFASVTGFLQVIAATAIGNSSGDWNLPRSGLATTYNNSRTIRDGSGSGSLTPTAPSGHVTASVGSSSVQFGRNEVQQISAGNRTGGTFRLTFDGETTALPWDADSSTVQSALEALGNVAPGDVLVTGDRVGDGGSGLTVTFQGAYAATDVAQMTLDTTDLTGGVTDPAVSTPTAGDAVTGVAAGDTVTVFDSSGSQLGTATAGPNGFTAVLLSTVVAAGQSYYVVVTEATTLRRSRTATLSF